MKSYKIPFNKPGLAGSELVYMADAVQRGQISGDGVYSKRCHEWLERELGVARALLTTSCTHALEMAALLLDLQPGDEVIVPSFTFVSTANAFVLRGAKPVFVDIRPDTLNLDERLLEAAISPRTKAVVPVHYAGVGCEMDRILGIARDRGIAVVEDNAHGILGKYRGRGLGTFGALATLSFHETKNLVCGEGGALLINDPGYRERAEILRDKGTDRSRFFRGQVDKYTWIDLGSSYLMSDLLAAFLWAQMEHAAEIGDKRRRIWRRYRQELAGWATEHNAGLPFIPEHCEQSHHMFYLLMPDLRARTALIEHLGSRGILSVFHYLPLHLSPMGVKFGGRPGQCPVTENVSDRLLRLPFYNDLTEAEQQEVIDAIREFRP
ncbi:MAG TPA: dTDP-4-amino-4,6-dideoxygalactose transaminase [Bryobacteraceae bacterium]